MEPSGDRELMRAHVAALFTLDSAGRLPTVNEPGGSVAPRFFFGRTAEGVESWFRHDVDGELVTKMEAALFESRDTGGLDKPSAGPTVFQRLLSESAPIQNVWSGPAYRFADIPPAADSVVLVTQANADVLKLHFEDWLGDVSDCQPFAVVLQDGNAVSLCASVRTTSQADEAGVETHPEFRGRGHAAEATAVWATVVRELGRAPLYSTSWENAASRRVAAKLGLVQFGSDLHIT